MPEGWEKVFCIFPFCTNANILTNMLDEFCRVFQKIIRNRLCASLEKFKVS